MSRKGPKSLKESLDYLHTGCLAESAGSVPIQREQKYPAYENLKANLDKFFVDSQDRWREYTNGERLIEEFKALISRCEKFEKVNKIYEEALNEIGMSTYAALIEHSNLWPDSIDRIINNALKSAKAIAGEDENS